MLELNTEVNTYYMTINFLFILRKSVNYGVSLFF